MRSKCISTTFRQTPCSQAKDINKGNTHATKRFCSTALVSLLLESLPQPLHSGPCLMNQSRDTASPTVAATRSMVRISGRKLASEPKKTFSRKVKLVVRNLTNLFEEFSEQRRQRRRQSTGLEGQHGRTGRWLNVCPAVDVGKSARSRRSEWAIYGF